VRLTRPFVVDRYVRPALQNTAFIPVGLSVTGNANVGGGHDFTLHLVVWYDSIYAQSSSKRCPNRIGAHHPISRIGKPFVNINEQTITKLYTAFADLDAQTMASCYAEDATFNDPAFSLHGRTEVAGMWRMLCSATQAKGRKDWKLEFRDIHAGSGSGRAHWEVHYRFGVTGRLVHNIIDAEFTFNPEGLIVTHNDEFNFWRWSVQALGIPGFVLGWSSWFKNKVRTQTETILKKFLAQSP
jgi:hypothetical protein